MKTKPLSDKLFMYETWLNDPKYPLPNELWQIIVTYYMAKQNPLAASYMDGRQRDMIEDLRDFEKARQEFHERSRNTQSALVAISGAYAK